MKPVKILLVNDEPVQRFRIASILKKEGYIVIEAEDGWEALKQIDRGLKPSLIIADLYMPRLDGWQLCREIREKNLQIPVLVISALFEEKEIIDLLKALGISDFLRSPVKKKTLLQRVKAILEGYSLLRQEEPFNLLFASSIRFSGDSIISYMRQRGFKVTVKQSFEEAQIELREKDFHLALITSEFSPEEIFELKQSAPHTSFIVLLLAESYISPFLFVLKGVRHVIPWPGELEFLNYLCQRELREKALLTGQELLRKRTRELKKVSKELKRIQRVLQIVVEQAAEMGIVVTNERLEPFFVNTKAKELFSLLKAKDFTDFFKSLLEKGERENLLQKIYEEGRYSCEVRVPEQQEVFSLTVKPLSQDQDLKGFIFFIVDVTHEREWQKRLMQIQKMEAIATLSAGIAHDFNNLLAAIRLKAELLSFKLKDYNRDYVLDIINICDRAAQVVKQIISFSRPMEESFISDLNIQAREAINFLKETIPKGIRIQMQLANRPLLVKLDPGQLSQVIMNICLNAVQAMGERGTLSIQTGTTSFPPNLLEGYVVGSSENLKGEYVWISIKDTGSGIKPEILPKIFDPYFTTKEDSMGTGLGLSMSYGIVKQAQGKIVVNTSPNKGSSFTIYLPRAQDVSSKKFTSFTYQPVKKAKILVIEDEDMIRQAIVEFLQDQGYQVKSCADGLKALKIISKDFSPELLILDLNIPGLSGLELIQKVKKMFPHIGILVLTGKLSPIDYKMLEQIEINSILLKPFSFEEFYDNLCRVLNTQK